ncbi:MAG: CvpA family protein [Betaproteobacteria bacterium]|jgi:membrane protein required for colicin V production
MTWIDYAVLAIIGVSVLFSVIHGFVRELLSLASWVVAFLVAQYFAIEVAAMLPANLSNESLRLLVGFLAVFLMVLLASTLLAIALSGLIKRVGLGFADRLLGAVFGLVRGLAVVMVMVLLAGLTALPSTPEWRQALTSAPLEALANTVKVWLPSDLSKHINYG